MEASIARLIAEDPDTAPKLTDAALDQGVIVGPDGSREFCREQRRKEAE